MAAALSQDDLARLVGYAKFWRMLGSEVERGTKDPDVPVGMICEKAGHVPDGRLVSSGLVRGSCARCGWTNWIRRAPA